MTSHIPQSTVVQFKIENRREKYHAYHNKYLIAILNLLHEKERDHFYHKAFVPPTEANLQES